MDRTNASIFLEIFFTNSFYRTLSAWLDIAAIDTNLNTKNLVVFVTVFEKNQKHRQKWNLYYFNFY
jgi:hypothetical protein